MAHELDFSLGRAAMAYVNDVPWHGLGAKLEPGTDKEAWIHAAGLDWTAHRSLVQYKDLHDELRAVKDREVLFRSDTGAPLAVVSDRYHVVQPREVVEFFEDLVSLGGFTLETAGALAGGKRIWALAKTNYDANVGGQDLLKGYLLLATSFDGAFATTAALTDVRVVCANTLRVSLGHADRATDGVIRVPHIREFDAQQVKYALGVLDGQWEQHVTQVERLAKTKVSAESAEQFVRRLFPTPAEAPKRQRTDIPTSVLQLFDGRGVGAELDTAHGTAWGLLNAVTEFVDHHRRSRGPDGRLNSAWFGDGARVKQQAWAQAMELAA